MANTTNRVKLPYILQSQSQKEVTHNAALDLIDALIQAAMVDISVNTPPGSPNPGDCYIVGSSPTGAWIGYSNYIAFYTTGWNFIPPVKGMTVWIDSLSLLYTYTGTAWALTFNPTSFQNLTMLGVNATADATNKLAVSSSAVLFNNIGNGIQIKLNKNANTDTASFLYQTGFSGRAEIGLTGDDNFHFKVSPDGSAWYDAFDIDRNTGNVTFNQQVNVARVLSVQAGGDANPSSSGSGADHDHSLTYSLPASFLTLNKLLRITFAYNITTGSAPPNLIEKLKFGSTTVAESVATITPTASLTNNQFAVSYLVQATSAPGASGTVQIAPIVTGNAPNSPFRSDIAQPVTLATNGALVIKASTQWSAAGTGTNTITLSQFIVEALN